MAAKAPETRFILNHAGMWADRGLAGWETYKAGLRTLAAQPNIVTKISGIGMLDPNWTVESMRPIVLETLSDLARIVQRVFFAGGDQGGGQQGGVVLLQQGEQGGVLRHAQADRLA